MMNAARRRRTHAVSSALRNSPPAGKKILVVDDDLPSREGLKDSLLAEGYRVETAADGWQALRTILTGRFDVAIIDLELPVVHGVRVSGCDITRIVRAYNPAVSIILVSADDSQAVRAQAEQFRVAEFLEKPISPARLKAIVSHLDPRSEADPGEDALRF